MTAAARARSTVPSTVRLGWSPLEYACAAACATNVIHQSYTLMQTTVVAWSCPNPGWVVGWSFAPALVYLVAVVTFRLAVHQRDPRRLSDADSRTERRGGADSLLAVLWRYEAQPCAQRELPAFHVQRPWLTYLLWILPYVCYVQCLLGITVLSSLYPVIARDAVIVLLRYSISGSLAGILVALELKTLREGTGDLQVEPGKEDEEEDGVETEARTGRTDHHVGKVEAGLLGEED